MMAKICVDLGETGFDSETQIPTQYIVCMASVASLPNTTENLCFPAEI